MGDGLGLIAMAGRRTAIFRGIEIAAPLSK
jgi:hypothetical protein